MNTPEETADIVTEMWERNYEPTAKDAQRLEKEINELLDGFFYKSTPDVAKFYEVGLREEKGGLIEEMEEQNETKTEIIDDPFGEQRRMENEWRKEMKYKVGDKVRVREDLVAGNSYGDDTFLEDMEVLRREVVEIDSLRPESYLIKEDDGKWNWTDEMFEGLANNAGQDPIQPDHYKNGDKDLFDEWYDRLYHSEKMFTGREVFIIVMKSLAERYTRRYPDKNPEDLSKGVYTLKRLEEYEEGAE